MSGVRPYNQDTIDGCEDPCRHAIENVHLDARKLPDGRFDIGNPAKNNALRPQASCVLSRLAPSRVHFQQALNGPTR